MPSTDKYPLALFTTVRQALQLLENREIDPSHFLQRLIDDPSFREKVIKLYREANPTALYGIPSEPHNLERFISHLFNIRIRTADEIREFHAEYLSDRPERLAEDLEENERNIAVLNERVAHYRIHENFLKLFERLDERSVSIVVMHFRLDGDDGMRKLREVAQAHQISDTRCRQLEIKALAKMRKTINLSNYGYPLPENPIQQLELSDRTEFCLLRARIETIDQLTERTELDLLNITNFGLKSLVEVKQRLAERGLSLRQ